MGHKTVYDGDTLPGLVERFGLGEVVGDLDFKGPRYNRISIPEVGRKCHCAVRADAVISFFRRQI